MANGNGTGLKAWLYGLGSAFIGGGASSVTAAVSANLIDPDHFNLAGGFGHTLELMGATFLISGLLQSFAFLKQSPLPRETWTPEERTEKLADPKPPQADSAKAGGQ